MTWTTTRNAVRAAIAEALELGDALGADEVTTIQKVCWENQAQAARFQSSLTVDLSLGAVRQLFRDEKRRDLGGDPDDPDTVLTVETGGMREFTVTVLLVNDDQSEGQETVGELADKLRRRLRWDGILGDLHAAGVALVWMGQVQNADGRDMDGRMLSRALLEIRFRSMISEIDTSDPGYWIESAEMAGEADTDLEGELIDTTD